MRKGSLIINELKKLIGVSWMENGKGEKTTPGSALVTLPSRGAQ